MNDSDNFLSRWSRRKRQAGERKDKEKDKEEAAKTSADSSPESETAASVSAPDAAPTPKFDLETLPPIESINAETDITAFMQSGVPETLKRAALRRAWSADPSIRDFMGPNENYWDAAGPDGIPGFGDLDPNFDVQRMVAQLFGEAPHKDAAQPGLPTGEPENAALAQVGDTSAEDRALNAAPAAPIEGDLLRRGENAAAQKEAPESEPVKKIARRHGSAMPE